MNENTSEKMNEKWLFPFWKILFNIKCCKEIMFGQELQPDVIMVENFSRKGNQEIRGMSPPILII